MIVYKEVKKKLMSLFDSHSSSKGDSGKSGKCPEVPEPQLCSGSMTLGLVTSLLIQWASRPWAQNR